MKIILKYVDSENIETKLIDNDHPGVPFSVVVHDLDVGLSGGLITRVNCPSKEVAMKYFKKYSSGV